MFGKEFHFNTVSACHLLVFDMTLDEQTRLEKGAGLDY